MASAVASEVAEVPKPVFLMDVASASAGTKTVASASHLSSTEGAAPRSSDDDVKDSTGVKDSAGVKASAGVKDSAGVKASAGVKGSTGKAAAAAADRTRGRNNPIPSLFAGADVMDQFPEDAMQDLLQALAATGSGAAALTCLSPGRGAPLTRPSPGGRFWVSKEDADVVQLKMAMPGLGKEHVTMKAEKDTLVIKGEGDKDSEGGDDKGHPRYTYRVGLSSQAYKLDQIKAEMKNGVLMVTVPKIKDEERKDVFEIKVE